MRTIGLARLKAPQNYRRNPSGFTLLELTVVLAIIAALAGLVIPMISEQQDTNTRVSSEASMTAIRDAFIGNGTGPGLYSDVRYSFPGTTDIYNLRISHLLSDQINSTNRFAPYATETRKGWRGPYIRGGNVVQVYRTPAQQQLNIGNIFPEPTDKRYDLDTETFATRRFFPSISNPYGIPGEPTIADTWGNPVVLQIPTVDEANAPLTLEQSWRFARIVSAGPNGVLDTVASGVHLQALAGRLSDNTAASRKDDIVIFLNRADIHE